MQSCQGWPLLPQGNWGLATLDLCKNQTIRGGGGKEPACFIFIVSGSRCEGQSLGGQEFLRSGKAEGTLCCGRKQREITLRMKLPGWAAADWWDPMGEQDHRCQCTAGPQDSVLSPCCSQLWKLGVSLLTSWPFAVHIPPLHLMDTVAKSCQLELRRHASEPRLRWFSMRLCDWAWENTLSKESLVWCF